MTKIEWTHGEGFIGETWNPIRAERGGDIGWACVRVSPGCERCYAATQNRSKARGGTGLDYTVAGMAQANIFLDEKTLAKPLRWREPRTVFVCSMTDLFGDWVPDEWLDRMFAVMALTSRHTYIVLTKRPERMRAYISEAKHRIESYMTASTILLTPGTIDPDGATMVNWFEGEMPWPLPNVWLGVSVEDQRRADERIPLLLETPAAVRFISYEPALGPVDLDLRGGTFDALTGCGDRERLSEWDDTPALDWVIVGGESGYGARPCDLAWIRSVVAQCRAADVAVFVKQDSGPGPGRQGHIPDDLWLKEFPG